jgi:hypothetical protein
MAHVNAELQGSVPSSAVADVYLVEHTIGSIIRASFRIYAHHFGTLFLIYVLPVLPLAAVQMELSARESSDALPVVFVLTVGVNYLASAAMTVAVSDVCLGDTPTFARSYARVLNRRVLLLFWTAVLNGVVLAPWVLALVVLVAAKVVESGLAIAVAVVATLLPALVAVVWFMTAAQVVVLEGKGGVAALWRSKRLGDGSHCRGAIAIALLTAVLLVASALLGGFFGALFPGQVSGWAFRTFTATVQQGLAAPVMLIALTLVYYDRRVRKEAYDARALAEDLAR